MKTPPAPAPADSREARPAVLALGLLIAAATVAAYASSLGGAFLYDDLDSVAGNASIRHLATALLPPPGTTVSARPVLNLSFALNYALCGPGTLGYHELNVLIHSAAALLLFGIVRRTLAKPAAGARDVADSATIAFGVALLWALHPIQAESVAYVVQRAESLMGFFYLLALYAFIRGTEGGPGRGWAVLCVAACLLGMATKEVMATAPLIVLLYDRTFVAGSFPGAWRSRKALYLCLAACWVPLGFLVAGAGGRGGTAGFGSGMPWQDYATAQLKAVPHYLRLSAWPHPLVGDYGRILEIGRADLAVGGAVLLVLVAGTLVLLSRAPAAGFLGAWFLVILAPSSSIIPVSTEIMAEHRMYLPLAAVVAAGVLALDALLPRRACLAVIAVAALGLGALTVRRNHAYSTALAFWSDVTAKAPLNAGAWNNLGGLAARDGDLAGAEADFRRSLALVPTYADAHRNLGFLLAATGRPAQAVADYEAALRFEPGDPSNHVGLADALARSGRREAAVAEYREAVRLDPARADAWYELGNGLADAGDPSGAAGAYAEAVRLRPDFADARVNYGNVLAESGRTGEAVLQFREALRLEPGSADVHNNLGSLLAGAGRLGEARAQFEEALRLRPDYADARDNLERVRALEAARGGR